MTQVNSICPVCRMDTNIEIASTKYHGIYVNFCSEQCREMFISRPSLYLGKLENTQEPILKHRILRLSESLGDAGSVLLTSCLTKLMGVKDVVVNGDKVHIVYDLLQVTEKQIEKTLFEVGMTLGDDWLERIRRGWIHDSEDNELDNLAAPVARSYHYIPPK